MDELAKQLAELNENLKALRTLIGTAGGLHIYMHQVPAISAMPLARSPSIPPEVWPASLGNFNIRVVGDA